MIREKLTRAMFEQKKKQSTIIESIGNSGIKLTASQLSNFLSGKRSIDIHIIDAICHELGLELTEIV